MKRPLLSCCLLVLLTLLALDVSAQEEQVKLSLERYEQLMRAAGRNVDFRANWSSGQLSITLPGRNRPQLRVTLLAELTVAGAAGPLEVPLLPAEVTLDAAELDGKPANLTRRGGLTMLVLDAKQRKGSLKLTYRLRMPAGRGAVLVPLPALAGASWQVHGLEGHGPVDLWPGQVLKRSATTLSGTVPATFALFLRWGSDASGYFIRKADYTLSSDASGDGVQVVATLEVHLQGAAAWVDVAPSDVALIEVADKSGPLQTRIARRQQARVTGRGIHQLRVVSRQRIDRSQGQSKVVLGLVRASITRVSATVSGTRTIQFDPAVPVVSTVTGKGDTARTQATVALPPSSKVTMRWSETRAPPEDRTRINCETIQLLRLEEGVIRARVFLRYEVIRGKVKEFPIVIPSNAVLYKVAGAGIEDWPMFARTGQVPRHTRVILDKPRHGRYELVLDLEMRLVKGAGELALPLVRPLASARLHRQTGVVALFDGEKAAFADARTDPSLIRVGEDAIPVEIRKALSDKPGQVYKHIGAPGPLAAKVTAPQPREISFDARIHTFYSIKEGVLNARASAMIEVKSGKKDKVIVFLSENARPLSWTAPSLARRPEQAVGVVPPKGMKAYEVRFTRAFEGGIQIAVEFESLLPKALGQLTLPVLSIQGAELEEGALGIAAEAGIEVTAGKARSVRRVDIPELPNAIRLQSNRELLLAYTYVRGPWALSLSIKRYDLVQTLAAVAEQVWIESTVFADGHIKTMVVFQLANERQNHFRLGLPEGATVLKLFRDKTPVKASRDGSTITLEQLPKNRSFSITVIYETSGKPLKSLGELTIPLLQAGIRMGDVQWLVRFPRDVWIKTIGSEMIESSPVRYRASPIAGAAEIKRYSALANQDQYVAYLFTTDQVRPEQSSLSLKVEFGLSWNVMGLVVGSLLALLLLGLGIRVSLRWKRAHPRSVAPTAPAAEVLPEADATPTDASAEVEDAPEQPDA